MIYPGYIPVGNATLVVANVLTCNTHSPKFTVLVDFTSWTLTLAPPGTGLAFWTIVAAAVVVVALTILVDFTPWTLTLAPP